MIERVNKPFTKSETFKTLDKDVLAWFKGKYSDLSPPQKFSVKLFDKNEHMLISSPTGTGKTLSAFLGVINRLVKYSKEGKLENRVYSIYISPLRALGNDIERNLEVPLKEIGDFGIRHAVRNGDTTSYQKQRMNVKTPHILITTPESLAIMLRAPKFKEKLKGVESVIIDEIHALADNKRGTHLSLSLESLEEISPKFTRVGLSATISPIEEIAKYLVGSDRPCKIVDVSHIKKRDLKLIAKRAMTSKEELNSIYDEIEKIVDKYRTTLIFTNTRSGTESVVLNLKKRYEDRWVNVDEEILAHHSSLSREQRLDVEDILKKGKAKIVVSSTSLELGIDIGNVDAVIQIGSPKSIARCLQRVGRAGHNLTSMTKGYFICTGDDELIEVGVMLDQSYKNSVDSVIIPRNALDVLAQHVIGMSIDRVYEVNEAFELVRKAYPYKDLKKEQFQLVIDFLAGNSKLDEVRAYGKIWYEDGKFGRRGKSRLIYMSNVGTIPSEAKITVSVGKKKIGYIEEGFLERLKKGDVFSLGGRSYRFRSVRFTNVQAEEAFGLAPTVPRWFSEQLPLNFDLAKKIREFRSSILNMFIGGKSLSEVKKAVKEMPVDKVATTAISEYVYSQYKYMKYLLGDFKYSPDTWIIEHFEDKGSYKIIFHTLYGRRVNDAISRMLAFLISERIRKNIGLTIDDNGFIIHMPTGAFFGEEPLLNVDVEKLLRAALDKSELLKRRFRHVASRGFLILKRYAGREKTVGRQYMTSRIIFNVVKEFEAFAMLEETYREILEDYLDLKNVNRVIDDLSSGKINIIKLDTILPTPFGHNIVVSDMGEVISSESKKSVLNSLRERIERLASNAEKSK